MPKDSLNIYLTAQDGMSPVLASITDKTKALDKETQQLQATYKSLQEANKTLIDRKVELQGKLKDVNKEVRDAKKAFEALHDVESEDAYKKALEHQQELRDSLAATNKSLQENQKRYKENIETIRKGMGETNLKDMAKGLITGQLGQMAADALGGMFEVGLTSAIGTPQASLISDTISSAISGGTAGAMFGAPGIAIGATVGALSGLATGGTKIFEAKDDAFKDYYGGLYEDASARSDETVESGSTIAAGREKDKISFATIFGDRDTAEQYLDDLVDMANTTPFLYDDLTAMSKTLATYGYDAQNILPQLQVIGDTGAALGMGTSDMTAVAQALGRMKSSDKTTLEYLNILNDRGIGAVGMLADAKGVSVGDMYGMISKGEVSGTEAVEIITAALKETYSGSMLTQSKTFEGISSTLEGLEQELENAAGEGYNTLRTEGKQKTVEAYQGELGDEMKEINSIIGENRARKENLQAQYETEVMDAVLSGKKGGLWGDIDADSQNKLDAMHSELLEWKSKLDESKASGDEEGAALASANIEALYEEAQTMGQSLFDNSEFMKILNDTELDEIQAILDNTAGLQNATQAAYNLAQQLSKGMGSSFFSYAGRASGDSSHSVDPTKPVTNFSDAMAMRGMPANWTPPEKSHAFGLARVPFDDYPALLHEGERVLTAREARAQDQAELPTLTMQRPASDTGSASESGGTAGDEAGPAVTISGNTFVGTSEEMADQLWEIIVRKLEREFKAAGR